MLNIYKKLRNIILIACGLYALPSCNIINPVEPVPTYIHIDSFNFITNPVLAGSHFPTTSQITNVSVYYNNISVGNFDLPCTFPIITNGTGNVEVQPGVIIDGLNSMTTPYPFYTSYTFSLTPNPGKTDTVIPVTEYYGDIKVQSISNFLGGATDFTWVGGDVPIRSITGDTLGPSKYAGIITLNNAGDSSIDSSNAKLTIATGAVYAFIEFDYKSSLPFYVGLSANLSNIIASAPYYLTGIYPSSTWQKFYLNVIDFNNTYQGTSYSFYLKASLPTGQASGELLIENIQLITF